MLKYIFGGMGGNRGPGIMAFQSPYQIGNCQYHEYSTGPTIESLLKWYINFWIGLPGFSGIGASFKGHYIWPSISSYPAKNAIVHLKSVFPCFYLKDFYLKRIQYL